MGFLSSLKSLLGGSGDNTSAKVSADIQQHQYQGFDIETQPTKTGGGYRVNGMIRKDGQEHQFVRADLASSISDAHDLTLFKARQAIDQMGERIFN
ncbi:MAG: HlyU family transcriptional regulator [Gammaproteobacteria bacterium]|nr:HlyU family transcriptional regulator [Gammaproteobacteria bacterium]